MQTNAEGVGAKAVAVERCRKELRDGVSVEDIEVLMRESASVLSEEDWRSVKKCEKKQQMDELLDRLMGNVGEGWNVLLNALEEGCFPILSTLLKQTMCLIQCHEELMQIDDDVMRRMVKNLCSQFILPDSMAVTSQKTEEERIRLLFEEILTKNQKYFELFLDEIAKTDADLATSMRRVAGTDDFVRESKDVRNSGLLCAFRVKRRTAGEVRMKKRYELGFFTEAQATDADERLRRLRETLTSAGRNYVVNVEREETTLSVISPVYDEPSLEEKLRTVKAEGERFTEDDVVQILQDVVGALGKLHQHGVVHGNLKPSNIVRDDSGEIILIDVCIEPLRSFHSDNNIYRAPEVRHGQPFTVQSDVCSLGVMAFELLTGRVPENMNGVTVFPKGSGISQRMKKLVRRMLSVDPRSRPSVEQVIKYLSGPTRLKSRFTWRVSKLRRTLLRKISRRFKKPYHTAETQISFSLKAGTS